MPRADLSNEELQLDDAPHINEDINFLLEMEMRPLCTSIIKKDIHMMKTLWRRPLTWESCHFYKLIEFLIQRKYHKGLESLLSPKNQFITHFYEP